MIASFGFDGNDTIYGGLGADTVYAGDGDDYISSDAPDAADFSASYLDGGNGDDTIFGGFGIDTLLGGDGNDAIYDVGTVGTTEFIDAGNGSDIVNNSLSSSNYEIYGGLGADVLIGGSGNDIINANAIDVADFSSNALDGGAGNDVLYGGQVTHWCQLKRKRSREDRVKVK